MSISATQVKELREKTGAGMMECKKALSETNGNMTEAMEVLRKRGLSLAAKRAGRTAAEGTIGSLLQDGFGVLVEVNCETDFVAKTDDFQHFVRNIANLVLDNNPDDVEGLKKLPCDGRTGKDILTDTIAKLGENIEIRRFTRMQVSGGYKLTQYLHAGNKIGVMVLFSDPNGKLGDPLARDVAMHVAAMNPHFIRSDEVPESVLAKEKEIQMARLDEEGKKPVEIKEKIVVGRLNKYLADMCLNDQIFVRDPEGKKTVKKVLCDIDSDIRIEECVRLEVGEG